MYFFCADRSLQVYIGPSKAKSDNRILSSLSHCSYLKGSFDIQEEKNVFAPSGICFPKGTICLLHSAGGFCDPAKSRKCLSFFPTNWS